MNLIIRGHEKGIIMINNISGMNSQILDMLQSYSIAVYIMLQFLMLQIIEMIAILKKNGRQSWLTYGAIHESCAMQLRPKSASIIWWRWRYKPKRIYADASLYMPKTSKLVYFRLHIN